MKNLLFVFVLLSGSLGNYAQEAMTISKLFQQMPDSLMPYLTKNNRLDMVDFMEAGMKAEVDNMLEGHSEMVYLSSDSLCINMSPALQVTMKLIKSDSHYISVQKIYQKDNCQTEKTVSVYSSDWQLLKSSVLTSALLRRDEEVFKGD